MASNWVWTNHDTRIELQAVDYALLKKAMDTEHTRLIIYLPAGPFNFDVYKMSDVSGTWSLNPKPSFSEKWFVEVHRDRYPACGLSEAQAASGGSAAGCCILGTAFAQGTFQGRSGGVGLWLEKMAQCARTVRPSERGR